MESIEIVEYLVIKQGGNTIQVKMKQEIDKFQTRWKYEEDRSEVKLLICKGRQSPAG